METEVGRKQTDADEKYIYTIIDYRQMKCSIPHIFSKKRNGQSRRISNHPPVGPSPKTVQEKNAGTIRRAKMSKKLKWARPIVSSFIFFNFPKKRFVLCEHGNRRRMDQTQYAAVSHRTVNRFVVFFPLYQLVTVGLLSRCQSTPSTTTTTTTT